MKKFILSTDMTADLPQSYIDKYDIVIQQLFYTFDNIVYGVDTDYMDPDTFYHEMREGKNPTTSASNPGQVKASFEAFAKQGLDVLHISFSSGLSSTHNTTTILAQEVMEEYPDITIKVVDSLSASLGQGLLVLEAAEMQSEGKSLEEVAQWVEQNRLDVVHQFTVEDLFHLSRGGRISMTNAILGSALSIKPLMSIDNEGKLVNTAKLRGTKKMFSTLVNSPQDLSNLARFKRMAIAHGGNIENALKLKEMLEEKYEVEEIIINHLGPIIGAHTGPDVLSCVFLGTRDI